MGVSSNPFIFFNPALQSLLPKMVMDEITIVKNNDLQLFRKLMKNSKRDSLVPLAWLEKSVEK